MQNPTPILEQIANDERRPENERLAARRAGQQQEDILIEQALGRKLDKQDGRYGPELREICAALREKPQTVTWLTPTSEIVAEVEAPNLNADLVTKLEALHRRTGSNRVRDAVIFTLSRLTTDEARKAADQVLLRLIEIKV